MTSRAMRLHPKDAVSSAHFWVPRPCQRVHRQPQAVAGLDVPPERFTGISPLWSLSKVQHVLVVCHGMITACRGEAFAPDGGTNDDGLIEVSGTLVSLTTVGSFR